jgi:hypothetical protein
MGKAIDVSVKWVCKCGKAAGMHEVIKGVTQAWHIYWCWDCYKDKQ